MSGVVVFGSLNMDLAIESDRMPQKGETIPGRDFIVNPGGKGANQAVAAAKAGVPTRMIGAVGEDLFGDRLLAELAGHGVDCAGVARAAGVETGVAVILRSGGDNRIVLSAGANGAIAPGDAEAALERLAAPGDVFVTQMECDAAATEAAIRRARALGLYVMVNVAPPRELPRELWSCVDLVCVNETECAAVTGVLPEGEDDLPRALEAICALGPAAAVITLGERGSVALADGVVTRVAAVPVKAVDTTAAGDTYLGYLAAARVRGASLPEAMRTAARAAALTATRVGAQQAIPTAEELGL